MAVPGKPQSESPLVKHIKMSQCWRSTFGTEVGHCLWEWDTLWDAGKFWNCTGLTKGCLEEEPKKGKGGI